MDFGGEVFAFFEVKYGNAELPYGQRLHLTSLADKIQDGGGQAAVFVVQHSVFDVEEDVDVADCNVREVYYNHRWGQCKQPITLKSKLDAYLRYARQNPFKDDLKK